MNLAESLRIAIRMLAANGARTALTVLGMVVGVATVILLVSIGGGVRAEVVGQLENLGSNLIFVFPGDLTGLKSGNASGASQLAVKKPLTQSHADLITRRLGDSAYVVPVLQAPVTVRAGNRTFRAGMAAGTDQGEKVFRATRAAGRHYTRQEWLTGARVVALGADVRNALFPNQDPVGKIVDIEGQAFTVVAYYAPSGGSLSGSDDRQVYIPSTTGQRLLGTDHLSEIVVKAKDSKDVELVRAQIEQMLRPSFGREVTVMTQNETLGVVSGLAASLQAMLVGLASISLVVAGIGIMNIMLVSVSERTREIGIRKAVGARRRDILSQFVIEATVLSAVGGAVGIALGAGVGLAIRAWVPVQVTVGAVSLAFVFSVAVGMFFGVYPAWKASRLDAIEALRYE